MFKLLVEIDEEISKIESSLKEGPVLKHLAKAAGYAGVYGVGHLAKQAGMGAVSLEAPGSKDKKTGKYSPGKFTPAQAMKIAHTGGQMSGVASVLKTAGAIGVAGHLAAAGYAGAKEIHQKRLAKKKAAADSLSASTNPAPPKSEALIEVGLFNDLTKHIKRKMGKVPSRRKKMSKYAAKKNTYESWGRQWHTVDGYAEGIPYNTLKQSVDDDPNLAWGEWAGDGGFEINVSAALFDQLPETGRQFAYKTSNGHTIYLSRD